MADFTRLPHRIASKIERRADTECWLWTAALDGKYGVVWLNGRQAGAHRAVYELLVGPIPDGLQIDHLCRVRICVNPDHLEPVTARENVLRGVGITALCAKKTHCQHGHEFTPENTGRRREGTRYCRTCSRRLTRSWARRTDRTSLTPIQRPA